ncbi:MAG: hypothetical protein K6F37_03995 [Lachnospiraceae bacterium]|nr:hypothetical protein [Lachnospiraceae bacterium]
MLGKLIKYDLKSMFRSLLPVCGAFIVVGFLAGISFPNTIDSDTTSGVVLLWGTILFALIALTVAVSIISLIIVITRFYKNLLGNEGYLSFTLPVTTGTHLAAKCISGYIAFALAVISGIISYGLFAVFACARTGDLDEIGEFFNGIFTAIAEFASAQMHYAVVFVLMAIVSTIMALIKIYFSIMIGHQASDHKILMSFVAYIVITIIESVISNIIGMVFIGVGVFASLFGEMTFAFAVTTLILNTVLTIGYIFGTYYLLNNRLNLE